MPYGKTRVRQRLTAVSKGCWRYGTPKLPLIKASCPADWQRKRMLKRTSRGSDATLLTSQLAKGCALCPSGQRDFAILWLMRDLGLRGLLTGYSMSIDPSARRLSNSALRILIG